MRMMEFPSIDQFRSVVKHVRQNFKFANLPLPILRFHGTVKMHGTNAAVVLDPRKNKMWAQSRGNIITPEKDNCGFAQHVEDCKDSYLSLLNRVADKYGRHYMQSNELVCVYGEWCGGNIQKGVALGQLPKMFVVFAIKVAKFNADDMEERSFWQSPEFIKEVCDSSPDIFCSEDFQTWDVNIDFSCPEAVQNGFIGITEAVEKECPVGKFFGVSGVGEGVVWRCVQESDVMHTHDLVFKVKGEKHSESRVKTLTSVDTEKMESVNAFVSYVLTDHRLEKMLDKLSEEGLPVDPSSTGKFLSLVGGDVIKEESDTMEASGLDRKTVMGPINAHARQWFMKRCNEA